jgi:alcohol dehydrogenase (cytochrome c)
MAATPAFAAEVTSERLINADREPQNLLMNHRTYDGQRFSPLARINRDNVKNLKLAFAVPLGGRLANGVIEATPLVEDGYLYITDNSGVLYKIDARSGNTVALSGPWHLSGSGRTSIAVPLCGATSSSCP